jgi:hypothetical protein
MESCKLRYFNSFEIFDHTGFRFGLIRIQSATIRLTAEVVKNLSAASGVAYIRLGAILTFLAAPNPAPKGRSEYGSFGIHVGSIPVLRTFA